MATSKKQISLFGEIESTSSQEDSLVNPTHQQANDSARRMIDISGRRCLEQFERLGRDGLLARTFVGLLIGQMDWYSRRCILNWKLKGTKYNRSYFQLAVLALPTEEIESGLLPTPMAQSRETNKEKTLKRKEKYGGMKRAMYLENYLAMGLLPTPNTMDTLPPREGEAMERIAQGARKGRTAPSNLREYVNPGSWEAYGMLPTPCTRDYKGANSMDHLQGKNGNKMTHEYQLPNFVKLKTGSNSQLNPRFVAEMMGFPPDWTELPFQNGEENQSKDTETQ